MIGRWLESARPLARFTTASISVAHYRPTTVRLLAVSPLAQRPRLNHAYPPNVFKNKAHSEALSLPRFGVVFSVASGLVGKQTAALQGHQNIGLTLDA